MFMERLEAVAGRGARVVAAVLLLPTLACDELPPVTGERYDESLRSEVVGAEYILRIRTPPSYDEEPERRYPVVFQLDPTFAGLDQLEITAGIVSQDELRGEGPEAIVVGVDYPDPYDRFRDYEAPEELDPAFGGGGADRFHRALQEEIVPHVDATLRTVPEQRVLVGHSMGGFFALYAAFRHDPGESPLFAGVVANDPTYSQDLMTYERWHAERSQALPMRIYRAIARYNGPLQELSHRWMGERLAEREYEGLEAKAETFDTDHGGVVEPGYASGLRFVLGGGR